jgi:hypothetical protein
MEALFALLGLIAIGGVLYWLAQTNAKDRQRMGEILGLTVIEKGPEERGEDYVMGHFHQTAFLRGELLGHAASVWLRSVRRLTRSNSKNQSLFTVLAFDLPRPSAVQFRIEPALTGALQSFFGGDQPAIPTGDDSFDKLFRFTATDAAAAGLILTPAMRQLLLAFRKGVVGDMPETALGRFSGDLLFGTFALEPSRVTYTVSGTPSEKIARHFEMAAQFLAEFAKHVQAPS